MTESTLATYAQAWVRQDMAAALATLAPGVEITECYGPVYHGADRFCQWFIKWFADGGIVHQWTITNEHTGPGVEFAEWTFECTWAGERSTFEGCSIAELSEGRIVRLREYATSAPLYEWTGQWR